MRPTNLMIAPEWNAIVCHDGGPFYINTFLANDYVDHFSGTFSRVDNGKPREFTEYILPGDMEDNFSNSSVDRIIMNTPPQNRILNLLLRAIRWIFPEKQAARRVRLSISFPHNGSELNYDEASGPICIREYGSAHVDPGNNNQQLAFKNVILQKMSYNQLDDHGYMVWNCLATAWKATTLRTGRQFPLPGARSQIQTAPSTKT